MHADLRPTIPALLALLALLTVGCTERDPGRMTVVDPPGSWGERLAADRVSKDSHFLTDPEAPLHPEVRAAFEGLSYWPPDRGFYFLGPVNRYPEPERFEMLDTGGKMRACERVGWIDLVIAGTPQSLQVYHLLDTPQGSLFLPFMDSTTGKETYPAGRYVELEGPSGGPFVLDFNRAYNPYCAYGDPERFACPVTPPENRLDVAIEAGERGYYEREGDA